ncbi:hypothetical protein ACHAWF_018368 [Thalassiosira exigua]
MASRTDPPTPSPIASPSASPSASPTVLASLAPSVSSPPSYHPTATLSISPSFLPSSSPTTPGPSHRPSVPPTDAPSFSVRPSTSPTTSPTSSAPTASPTPFVPGDLAVTNWNVGIRHSTGLNVKRLTRGGEQVRYADGGRSNSRWHSAMDGAGIVDLPDGGYVYVSNSERSSGGGGVYGLYFNERGNAYDYKMLLSGTGRNCGGGVTPWNTWISCEEEEGGQCWQIDPDPNSANHDSPKATLLGGSRGGEYESVRDPDRPVFFTTEDVEYGPLRRFVANGRGFDALHAPANGQTTFLRILDGSNFEWTTDEDAAARSAATYYANSEGVSYHDGFLYFVAKVSRKVLILDLTTSTYKSERTTWNAQPDQVYLAEYKRWIYFSEDGGSRPGVHVRDKETGTYLTLFDGIGYDGDETVGITLSPDRKRFYAGVSASPFVCAGRPFASLSFDLFADVCARRTRFVAFAKQFQDAGVLLEFTRDDGMAFQ